MAAYHDRLGRPAPDYRLVKQVADRVLEENVISVPPVLPRDICDNYGIGVLFADSAICPRTLPVSLISPSRKYSSIEPIQAIDRFSQLPTSSAITCFMPGYSQTTRTNTRF